MRVIDPGHLYALQNLDAAPDAAEQPLRFVKRNQPPEKYPGNEDAYAGTTLQEVFRACIDRLQYVNKQIRDGRTEMVITHLRKSILELELRAADRHSRKLVTVMFDIENEPTCSKCGHIKCDGSCHGEEVAGDGTTVGEDIHL